MKSAHKLTVLWIVAFITTFSAARLAIAQPPVDADWTANAKIESLQIASDPNSLAPPRASAIGRIASTSTATSTRPSRGSASFASTRSI